MPTFASFDGTELWFDDQGASARERPIHRGESGRRPAVLLLHGFAADTNINWVRSGILDALVDDDFRTVALDHRGHGLSAKPHDPEAYADDALTRDAQALLDHLGLESVVVIGYSMGSGVALRLGAIDPRVKAVIAIGVGSESIARRASQNDASEAVDGNAVGDALLADDPDTITDPLGKRFRTLADSIRADRVALAACMSNMALSPAQHAAELAVPVLVVAGIEDDLAGDPHGLADKIAGARAVTVPGDHFTANANMPDVILEFVRAQ